MGHPRRQQFTIPAAVAGMLVAIASVRIVSEEIFWMFTAVFLAGLVVLGTMRLMYLSREEPRFEEDGDVILPPKPLKMVDDEAKRHAA